MGDKVCLFLFICLLGLQVSCQTGQATSSDNFNQPVAESTVSDDDIQELFIFGGLGEGDGNLKKLMALPRERVVTVVQKLKDNGIRKGERGYQSEYQSPGLKIKSAYFLWKLGVDSEANEKYIVEATKDKNFSIKFEAVSWLCAIVGNGKKEHLPIILQTTPEADGGYAEGLQGFYINQILDSPKTFLLYLSKQDSKVRNSVYGYFAMTDEMFGQEKLDKVNAVVETLRKDQETKTIAGEFLREVKKRQ